MGLARLEAAAKTMLEDLTDWTNALKFGRTGNREVQAP